MKHKRVLVVTCFALLAAVIGVRLYVTANHAASRNDYVPTTISPAAQQILTDLYQLKFYGMKMPQPHAFGAWRKIYNDTEAKYKDKNIAAAKENHVTYTNIKLNDIPALDIKPEHWQDNHKLIVYLHGGAYVIFSPMTTLVISAPISRATGQRIIAVDYTLSPFADWQQIQNQVLKVFEALLKSGYKMSDITILGDSAGGGLALNTFINLRDKGLGMPASLVLLSPWSDLTDAGDTMHTLNNTDPILSYPHFLQNSALAYAKGLDLADPRVSPLYTDFTKPFPPVLITEGTKCIFLSSSVRLYQALDYNKHAVKLDMYEGMWHVFIDQPMPEAKLAIERIAAFINSH